MKKYFICLVFLSTFITAYGTNPLDSNWRDFIHDKQTWNLGPVNNIIINKIK